MEAIAAKQGVARWAECTPDHLLHIEEIKRTIPDAVFVHMIRDGRDVALSMSRQGWVRPLPGNRGGETLAAGICWEWVVGKGREGLRGYPADGIEIHYEDLIAEPSKTLARLSAFLKHDLDYGRIQAQAVGTVRAPNTSFQDAAQDGGFQPVGRWKSGYTPEQLGLLESAIGKFLVATGYELASAAKLRRPDPRIQLERAIYRARFATRVWLKANTPLGRAFTSMELLKDHHAADADRLRPARDLPRS
jgi:hypothetical protein